jgi:hypothetical protein
MQQPSPSVGVTELLAGIVVVIVALAAAVLLHLGVGAEPPDNPGAAAQLAADAPRSAPMSAERGAE